MPLKRRWSLLVAGLLILMAAACAPADPVEPEPATPQQPPLTPSPTSTSPPAALPPATLACETHTASVTLAAAAESVQVGDTVKVTVTLNNDGCAALGLPQYRLYIQPGSILAPDTPEPITHSLGVAPDQSDTAVFDLQAVADGQAAITATVSFEVHLGYPGPAYWGSSASEPLLLAVAP